MDKTTHRSLRITSPLRGRNLLRWTCLSFCIIGPLSCSSNSEAPELAKGDVGASVGGATPGTGGAGSGNNSSASGGVTVTQIDPPDVDLPNPTDGTGGEQSMQDGGVLPLTLEQVTAIQEAECADVSAEAEKLPAALQFVVDVSGSMTFTAPTTGLETKWEVTLPALLAALDGIDDEMAVGLQLYPTAEPPGGNTGFPRGGLTPGAGGTDGLVGPGTGGTDTQLPSVGGAGSGGAESTGGAGPLDDMCADASGRVDIAVMGTPGAAQRLLLADALNTAQFKNVTPTHAGYVNALEQSLKPYPATGNKFMILMTDGAPTQDLDCSEYYEESPTAPIIASVAAAQAEGISTFIIGAPGTEGTDGGTAQQGQSQEDTRPWLSEAAMVGGTGPEGCTIAGPNFCHLDMTQAPDLGAALQEALGQIADKVAATCSFVVPVVEGEQIDPALTNVMISWSDGTSVLVLHDSAGDCSEGWSWGANDEIEICAETCTGIETDPGAVVTVSLGCTPEEIIIPVK